MLVFLHYQNITEVFLRKGREKKQLIACQPMSRKPLITVFVKYNVALVYNYDPAFLSHVLEAK